MDIKSIVRVFKFNELSQQAERDPTAKRPPTIKFLGLTLLVGALAVGFGYLVLVSEQAETTGSAGGALSVPTEPTNTTEPSTATPSPTPTVGADAATHDPAAHRPPE